MCMDMTLGSRVLEAGIDGCGLLGSVSKTFTEEMDGSRDLGVPASMELWEPGWESTLWTLSCTTEPVPL